APACPRPRTSSYSRATKLVPGVSVLQDANELLRQVVSREPGLGETSRVGPCAFAPARGAQRLHERLRCGRRISCVEYQPGLVLTYEVGLPTLVVDRDGGSRREAIEELVSRVVPHLGKIDEQRCRDVGG